MADDATTTTLDPDPTGNQLKSALRAVLIAFGAYAAGKGLLPPDLVGALATLILVGGPVLWAQIEERLKKRQLVTAALTDPASIAFKT